MPDTVLVTGGAGFIGSHLVDCLVREGFTVRVLDNFSTGRPENLAAAQTTGRVTVLEGSITESDQVRRAVQGVRWVFHLAARISVPESLQDPVGYHHVNVVGTVQVLQAARAAGVEAVVLASSAAVYGIPRELPLREDAAFAPLSPYASAKIANEMDAQVFTHMGLPVVVLRLFNVYGPRQRPDSPYAAVIPAFLRRLVRGQAPTIYGDGTQVRDFIFVEDVVQAFFLAARQAQRGAGRAFNICTGQGVSLLDLLQVMYRLLPNAAQPRFAEPRPGDIPCSIGDPSLAEEVLGFRAQTALEEGLRRTLAWMQKAATA